MSNNPNTYVWTAPEPAPKKSKLKPIIIAVVSLLAVAALVWGGLMIYKSTKSIDAGPLGWDEETLNDKLSGGNVKDCDLGDDFYASVGVSDLEVFDEPESGASRCEGWVSVLNGHVKVGFDTGKELPTSNMKKTQQDGLSEWRESTDPFEAAADPESHSGYGSNARCYMTSRNGRLNKVRLEAAASCDVLYPLAKQLTNIAIQSEALEQERGVFDNTQPTYLDVTPGVATVMSPGYKKFLEDTQSMGESSKVADDDYTGSTFKIESVGFDPATYSEHSQSEELCVYTKFVLGKKNEEYASKFEVPDLIAYFPNGQATNFSPDERYFRLQEGESKNLTYCSTVDTEKFVSDRAVLVATSEAYESGKVETRWEVEFERKN